VVAEPGGMLMGVYYDPRGYPSGNKHHTNGIVIVYASAPVSKDYPLWVAPSRPNEFQISLRDDHGMARLTDYGLKFGKASPTLKFPYDRPNLYFYGTNIEIELDHYDIDDVFQVDRPGNYKLVMTPQFYWNTGPQPRGSTIVTHHTLNLTNLTPITVEIPLKANTHPDSK
jgi:hypothetical protein